MLLDITINDAVPISVMAVVLGRLAHAVMTNLFALTHVRLDSPNSLRSYAKVLRAMRKARRRK